MSFNDVPLNMESFMNFNLTFKINEQVTVKTANSLLPKVLRRILS